MKRFLFTAGCLAVAFSITVLAGENMRAKKPGGGGGNPGGGEGGGETSYTIVKLDDAGGVFTASFGAGAFDINNAGNVVGVAANAVTGDQHSVFWLVNGNSSQIFPLGVDATAYGLNDSDEIVGAGFGNALYWAGPAAPPVVLPPLVAGLGAVAFDINADGVICGVALDPVFDDFGNPIGAMDVAVVWRVTYPNGEMSIAGPVTLPTTAGERSLAHSLNDNDPAGLASVTGELQPGSDPANNAAVQWTVQSQEDGSLIVDPNPVILETDHAAAYCINNLGVSCGQARLSGVEPKSRVWSESIGVTLLDPPSKPFDNYYRLHKALGVNSAGVIVGTAGENTTFRDAVVWSSAAATPVLLEKFLPKRNAPFAWLRQATAINEAGVIAGIGNVNGSQSYAFIAIPPTP